MASLYSNENVALEIVAELRRLGHDVLTSYDAGNANARVPDDLVLSYSARMGRVVVTNNRRDFIRLHRLGKPHAGIVAFTFHPDFQALGQRSDLALNEERAAGRFLARVDTLGFIFD